MKTLLLGRTGQIGGALALRLRKADLLAPTRDEIDLRDREAVMAYLQTTKPEVILNAAAYTAVDRAESEQQDAFAVNAELPATLAQWCRQSGSFLVHFSTDYVYPGDKGAPYVEDDKTAPLNVYGHSKLAGDEAILASRANAMILRTSWVYSSTGNNFVKTMLRLGKERDQINVVDDQLGCPTEAGAIADAVLSALETATRDKSSGAEVFHLAGRGETTWYSFAQQIFALGRDQGLPLRAKLVPISTAEYSTPAKRPAYSVLSCEKFEGRFGIVMPAWRDRLEVVVRALATAERKANKEIDCQTAF